jgi:hypothetical protein
MYVPKCKTVLLVNCSVQIVIAKSPQIPPVNFLSGQVEGIDHPVSRFDFSQVGFDEGLSSKTLYES